jgi:hypothetical protein
MNSLRSMRQRVGYTVQQVFNLKTAMAFALGVPPLGGHLRRRSETFCCRGSCRPAPEGVPTPAVDPERSSLVDQLTSRKQPG